MTKKSTPMDKRTYSVDPKIAYSSNANIINYF